MPAEAAVSTRSGGGCVQSLRPVGVGRVQTGVDGGRPQHVLMFNVRTTQRLGSVN